MSASPSAAVDAALDVLDRFLKSSVFDCTPIILTHPPSRRASRLATVNESLSVLDAQWEKMEALAEKCSQLSTRLTRASTRSMCLCSYPHHRDTHRDPLRHFCTRC